MPTFRNVDQIKRIPAPTNKDVLYVRHEDDKWFGVAVLRARADGFVRRSYFVRLGQTRKRLGEVITGAVALVGAIGFKEARKAAYTARAAYETDGASSAVQTLGSVWEIVRKKREKDWSPDTLTNYLRFVPPTLEEVEHANTSGRTIAPSRMYLLGVWQKRLHALKSDHLRECVGTAEREIAKRNKQRKTPLERNTGKATVASLGRFVNMLLAYAVNENWIRFNVMSPLVQDGLVRASAPRSVALQFDQIKPFWHWLDNHCYPAARDLILCAAFLGLRKSALGSMRWADIEQRGGRWHINVRPNTRGNKRRQHVVLPIPDYLVEKVFEPRKNAPDRHEEWVIESPKRRGKPLHDIKGRPAKPHRYHALAGEVVIESLTHALSIASLEGLKDCACPNWNLSGPPLSRSDSLLGEPLDLPDSQHQSFAARCTIRRWCPSCWQTNSFPWRIFRVQRSSQNLCEELSRPPSAAIVLLRRGL